MAMPPKLKAVAIALLPPIVSHAISRALRGPPPQHVPDGRPEWEHVPDSDALWAALPGWQHQSIADRQVEKWQDFLSAIAPPHPMGSSHEADAAARYNLGQHNTILSFAYVLGRVLAEARGERVSLLDWGGGVGHYARLARTLFPDSPIEVVVKDMEALCEAGRRLNPDIEFLSDEASAFARGYDLVLASSSLQYSRHVHEDAMRLARAARRYLLVTRTPFVDNRDDFVVVQRPYAYGYHTEYAGWFLNRDRFVATIEREGLRLERELLVDESPRVDNAPEQCRYRGFLFKRNG